MKKIVIPILVGSVLFISNYASADGDSAVKLRAVHTVLKTDVSKYIDVPKFVNKLSELDSTNPTEDIAPFVTLIELSYVCLNSVAETEKNINKENICYRFLVKVVRAHNKDIDDFFSNDDESTKELKDMFKVEKSDAKDAQNVVKDGKIDDFFSNDDESTKELEDLFKLKESDIEDTRNVVKDGKSVKEWSLTMFKPDKTTKICESNGFYFVGKLSEQPFDFLDFNQCFFETGTDKIACCLIGQTNWSCNSSEFQKEFILHFDPEKRYTCEVKNLDIFNDSFESFIYDALLEKKTNITYIQIK